MKPTFWRRALRRLRTAARPVRAGGAPSPVPGPWGPWAGRTIVVDDAEFRAVYEVAETLQPRRNRSVSGKISRAYVLKGVAEILAPLAGEAAECGVFNGTTAYVLAHYLAATHRDRDPPLHLFDSWEGLSAPHPEHDAHPVLRQGLYKGDESAVRRLLAPFPAVRFHCGWVPRVLDEVTGAQFSLVHLDMDLHDPTLAALEFFWPRLVPPAAVVLDDYGFPTAPGTRVATDAFCHRHGVRPLYLPTGQALLWRLR